MTQSTVSKHVTTVSAKCFFNCVTCDVRLAVKVVFEWTRSRRGRLEYSNSLLVNAPRTTTDNTAAGPE